MDLGGQDLGGQDLGGQDLGGQDLGGRWVAAEADDDLRRTFPRPELDDGPWYPIVVPGHWQAEPAFAGCDGPLLFRRRFETGELSQGQRAWLVMDGVFYQSDVWLDGSYLGDTEGYFFPHEFDVTSAMEARSEHLLAVEVGCERPTGQSGKRALTGVWGCSECIDPAFNPGGIWAPVRIVRSGPVHLCSLRVVCAEAVPRRAVLDLVAVLDSSEQLTVTLRTEARPCGAGQVAVVATKRQPLAVGTNRVRWRLEVPSPELWWPLGLGAQPLYDVGVGVELEGGQSDARALRTGLRQVRMRDYVWSVNGERLFLKGANLAPTRRDLAYASAEDVASDVDLACRAGLNLLRVRAHVARRELYRAADQVGMLIWQDMPLQGSYKGVRRQAVRQAAAAVDMLGHHPSIVVWCGHSDPFVSGAPVGTAVRPGRALRRAAQEVFPSSNKSVLDSSVRRAFERADPSRPVVANSGVLPHPAWGTGSHLYFGWYYGRGEDLSRAAASWPAAVRFVSELGAQAVPFAAAFMQPGRWPDLDWERLAEHYCMRKDIFDQRVPPGHYPGFEVWRDATQAYQARLVRYQVETLRRLRDRPTGGFAVSCLNDAQPGVSCALVDYERVPKAAYGALQAACAPVLVVSDWPERSYRPGAKVSFDVHVVNDLRDPLVGAVLDARLTWPGGGRHWRSSGDVRPSCCTFVGRLTATLPSLVSLRATVPEGIVAGPSWPLSLELGLRWGDPAQLAENRYVSVVSPRGGPVPPRGGPPREASSPGGRL
jgi:beta-mannosidase